MKERLEDFINANRSSFDDEAPPSPIWEEITKTINSPQKTIKVVRMPIFKICAAAVAVIVAGIFLFLVAENNKLKSDLTASQQRLEQQQIKAQQTNADYTKELNQIIQVVAAKQNQLSGVGRDYPTLYKSFTADINDLNKEYEKLKQVLPTVPEQEEVLDAMMQNLKLQAELLNEQLLIIQQIKSSQKNTNEKATPVI